MTFERAIELVLGNLGVLVLLLLILVGGYRKMWVWGWYARELQARNDKQEQQLERALHAGATGTGLALRAVDVAEQRRAGTADVG